MSGSGSARWRPTARFLLRPRIKSSISLNRSRAPRTDRQRDGWRRRGELGDRLFAMSGGSNWPRPACGRGTGVGQGARERRRRRTAWPPFRELHRASAGAFRRRALVERAVERVEWRREASTPASKTQVMTEEDRQGASAISRSIWGVAVVSTWGDRFGDLPLSDRRQAEEPNASKSARSNYRQRASGTPQAMARPKSSPSTHIADAAAQHRTVSRRPVRDVMVRRPCSLPSRYGAAPAGPEVAACHRAL